VDLAGLRRTDDSASFTAMRAHCQISLLIMFLSLQPFSSASGADETEEALVAQIREVLLNGRAEDIRDSLRTAGQRAVPYLRKIIEHPDSLKTRHAGDANPPVAADALTMLSQIAPKETSAFKELANHPDQTVARPARLALARSFDPSSVEMIGKAITGKDKDERFDMLGVLNGEIRYHKRRAEKKFVESLLPFLKADIRRGDGIPSSSKLFCRVDQKAALEFLCSEEIAKIGAPGLQYTMEALVEFQIPAPVDRILPIFEELSTRKDLKPDDFMPLRCSVWLLAAQKHPRAKGWIHEILAKGPPDVALRTVDPRATTAERIIANWTDVFHFHAAAYAYPRYEGIVGEIMDVAAVGRKEFDKLTEPQKTVATAYIFSFDHNGGGFSDVYTDSSAEFLDAFCGALERIGAKKQLEVLHKANATWGKVNPETNFAGFQKFNAIPDAEQKRIYSDLDDQFYAYDSVQSIDSLTRIYAAKNAEHFRHLKAPDPR
jgi:Domain of unknown function (DUF4375)